ncbi:helix-turn-helix transcriptional regulator, partial [Streptomyces sp. GC420]|uniref:helix-turn-helix domain-containing protein n=1 Tax=Streptomyces sp. GC420 TaxID=2697568 RepID=UPI0014150CD1
MTDAVRAQGEPEPPPDGLAPEVRHLLTRLREARARTGLSYAALGSRTPYSRSSWERYLNGKALPPRQAVEALARLSGADPARLLALWELAERAWRGRDAFGGGPREETGIAPELPPP